MSDEKDMPDEDCSDMKPDSNEDQVQVEDCESDSELEGDNQKDSPVQPISTVISESLSRPCSPLVQSDSDSDDVLLSVVQSRNRSRKKNNLAAIGTAGHPS